MAAARQAGKTTPFDFRSMLLRDGTDGKQGALAILRSGHQPGHSALLFKATSQGLGHGHFDRLNFLYYDNQNEVVADYGAARFLNVVQKNGGHYLPENKTWAKQTVAHNTLVVDERSDFDGKLNKADGTWPDVLEFNDTMGAQIVSAREPRAYPGVIMTRTMLMLDAPPYERSIIVDVMQAQSDSKHTYDLPLHYRGQLVDSSEPIETRRDRLRPFGSDHGYQHLWLRGTSTIAADESYALTWLLGNRFYTWTTMSDHPAFINQVEIGANDPDFNLLHKPAVIARLEGARDATFVSVIEAHGEYNGAREYTTQSTSQLKGLRRYRAGDVDLIELEAVDGQMLHIGLSYDADPALTHQVTVAGTDYQWSGFYKIFGATDQSSGQVR